MLPGPTLERVDAHTRLHHGHSLAGVEGLNPVEPGEFEPNHTGCVGPVRLLEFRARPDRNHRETPLSGFRQAARNFLGVARTDRERDGCPVEGLGFRAADMIVPDDLLEGRGRHQKLTFS